MKGRSRATDPEGSATLTRNSVKETGYPHSKPNRQKKQLIEMNKRYFFYFKNGICHYQKKRSSDE